MMISERLGWYIEVELLKASEMSNLDYIVELYELTIAARRGFIAQEPPDEVTIRATEEALGFTYPPTFRRFIAQTRTGAFFEKDLNHPIGFIQLNRLFHKSEGSHYLPDFLILFMGGHDGDCHCFDSRLRDENGECPVVYWDAENMREQDIEGLQPDYANFLEFLEFITDYELKQIR